jgi:hypothetical protein
MKGKEMKATKEYLDKKVAVAKEYLDKKVAVKTARRERRARAFRYYIPSVLLLVHL